MIKYRPPDFEERIHAELHPSTTPRFNAVHGTIGGNTVQLFVNPGYANYLKSANVEDANVTILMTYYTLQQTGAVLHPPLSRRDENFAGALFVGSGLKLSRIRDKYSYQDSNFKVAVIVPIRKDKRAKAIIYATGEVIITGCPSKESLQEMADYFMANIIDAPGNCFRVPLDQIPKTKKNSKKRTIKASTQANKARKIGS
jgi:hypothetical protein